MIPVLFVFILIFKTTMSKISNYIIYIFKLSIFSLNSKVVEHHPLQRMHPLERRQFVRI